MRIRPKTTIKVLVQGEVIRGHIPNIGHVVNAVIDEAFVQEGRHGIVNFPVEDTLAKEQANEVFILAEKEN